MRAFKYKNHNPPRRGRANTKKTTGKTRFVIALGVLWAVVSLIPPLFWNDSVELPAQMVSATPKKHSNADNQPELTGTTTYKKNSSDQYIKFNDSTKLNATETADLSKPPAAFHPIERIIEEEDNTSLREPISNAIATADSEEAIIPPNWLTFTIQKGDTLSGLFFNQGLSAATLHQLINSSPAAKKQLTRIKPGETISMDIQEGELKQLQYKANSLESLLFTRRSSDDFEYEQIIRKPTVKLLFANAVITDNLFTAATAANIPDKTTMQLASLFGWDIDFVQDIRKDDTFSLIYEEQLLDDQKIGYGKILAATFTNRGNKYEAVYYKDKNGKESYYSPTGKSMRKPFIRTPVEFTRISGRFAPNRLHPIFKTRRPHRGVDYAAPKGTPIKASGNGVIQFAGKQTGYGNVVYIKHSNNIVTVYAHQSRIARGIKKGQRVRQGQVIGYVGMTGWATGPHLHYEFRINGVHRNPLKVKFPNATPLNKSEMARFKIKSDILLASLRQKKTTMLAAAETYEQEQSTN